MPVDIISAERKARYQIAAEAHGVAGECFPYASCSGTLAFVTQDLRATLVGLRAGDTLSNIMFKVGSAGAGVTAARAALFKLDGTVLIRSANSAGDQTALQTVQAVTFALAQDATGAALTSYTVPADGGYYLGLWVTFATTAPQLVRGGATTGTMGAFGSGAAMGVVQNTASFPAAAATFGVANSAGWFGWS